MLGRVVASEPGPNGDDVPLGGVTLRVEGIPGLEVRTDVDGNFVLEDVPAPEFFVEIDGSTITTVGGQPLPSGGRYPTLGKKFHSVAGEATYMNMGGVPFSIHLPFVLEEAFHQVVPGQSLMIGLPTSRLCRIRGWHWFSWRFAADSLVGSDGTPGTEIGIFQVSSDRLPAPLPPGLTHAFDITVQADVDNFDIPGPITFPNIDGLAPGAKELLMSFDHALGEWVVVGSMTVSARMG